MSLTLPGKRADWTQRVSPDARNAPRDLNFGESMSDKRTASASSLEKQVKHPTLGNQKSRTRIIIQKSATGIIIRESYEFHFSGTNPGHKSFKWGP